MGRLIVHCLCLCLAALLCLASCGDAPPATVGKGAAPATSGGPRAIVVDAGGGGDFTELQDAVATAKPGDTIRVRAGKYVAAVEISMPLTIEGEGGATISHAARPVVTISGGVVTLRGLVFLGEGVGVDPLVVLGGSLTIEDCEIGSNKAACVTAREQGALAIARCKFRGGDNGVHTMGQATLEAAENTVSGLTKAGFWIQSRSPSQTIRGNQIFGNANGIFVAPNGQATCIENVIHANSIVGIAVGAGQVTIENNEIHSHPKTAAIRIYQTGKATIRGNRIHDCVAGIFIDDARTDATIEDNDVSKCDGPAVSVEHGATAKVLRNRLYWNKSNGIAISTDGKATVEENEIFDNTSAGLAVFNLGEATARRNKIYGHTASEGVWVSNRAAVTLEANEIHGNFKSGVEVNGGSRASLQKNEIRRNGRYGVESRNGTLQLISNILQENVRGAWGVPDEDRRRSQFAGNTIEPHPFQTAHAGDWATYRLKVTKKGTTTTLQMRSTVLRIGNDVVEWEREDTDGTASHKETFREELTEPFDIYKVATMSLETPGYLLVKTASEAVSVGSQSVNATRRTLETTVKREGEEGKSTLDIWTSPDVPLHGIARSEWLFPDAAIILEATGFGRGR